MSLPVPPNVLDALRQYLRDGKSGQVIWEVRGGEIVAVAFNHKIRLQGGGEPVINGIEFKGPALVR